VEFAQRRFGGPLESPEMRQGGRSLVCLPMFHIGGTIWAIWGMQTGSTVCIVREPLPEVLLQTMVEQRIESALLVPTLMQLMTELPASRTADFSALKLITYGTAPISPDLLRRSIETFECRFMQM
jgi:acyl-CoA synthetase (AMP-forming)/AMP-acid ligase II